MSAQFDAISILHRSSGEVFCKFLVLGWDGLVFFLGWGVFVFFRWFWHREQMVRIIVGGVVMVGGYEKGYFKCN